MTESRQPQSKNLRVGSIMHGEASGMDVLHNKVKHHFYQITKMTGDTITVRHLAVEYYTGKGKVMIPDRNDAYDGEAIYGPDYKAKKMRMDRETFKVMPKKNNFDGPPIQVENKDGYGIDNPEFKNSIMDIESWNGKGKNYKYAPFKIY